MVKSYLVKQFSELKKRFCQILELKNDPKLIEEYKYWALCRESLA